MSSEEDDLALAIVAVGIVKKKYNSGSKHGRIWCKEWLLKRNIYSHTNLLNELKVFPKDWHNYLRMDETNYLKLLSLVTPLIKKT